jgi:hypothetical protein
MIYPVDCKLQQYTTNEQYRQSIRILTKMDNTNYNPDIQALEKANEEYIDQETRDEMEYDADAISKYLDHVYSITRDNTHFQQLYSKSAASMISTDPEIGLAVLCSYDYLPLFHECMVSFIRAPDDFHDQNPQYKSLHAKLA